MSTEVTLYHDQSDPTSKVRTRGTFTNLEDAKHVIEGFKAICFACSLARECESRPRLGKGKTVFTDGKKAGTAECDLMQRSIYID
jgi:hypothetical protein